MLHRTIFFFLIFSMALSFNTTAQQIDYSFQETLKWGEVQHVAISETYYLERMYFLGALYHGESTIPYFSGHYQIHAENVELSAGLAQIKTVSLTPGELKLVGGNFIDTSFNISVVKSIAGHQAYAVVDVVPVRFNAVKGEYEKLISFTVNIVVKDIPGFASGERSYATNSVLSSGNWIKVRISEDGVYKVTYSQLRDMGLDVSVNPKNIAVFGNGGGLLPEQNDLFRHDDLIENPIVVSGEEDNAFNEGDYILFYGKGPVNWKLDKVNNTFFHQNNIYDNYAYYFITVLNKPAKRITEEEVPGGASDVTVNSFVDYVVHELDEKNLASTGRLWVGEVFDFNTERTFEFNFPNLITTENTRFRGSFATNSPTSSAFKVFVNDNYVTAVSVPATPGNGFHFGNLRTGSKNFLVKSDNLKVKVQYQRTSNSSTGYLDFMEFVTHRKLIMAGDQMIFRNIFNEGNIAQYSLQGDNNLTIWDVTDPVDVKKIKADYLGGSYSFKVPVEQVKVFVAFNGNQYKNVEYVENVTNQNLHGIRNIDYLIVAHPDFLAQAEQLARYHFEKDGYNYAVVTPGQVYNEFSSGAQDISAIRDFAKMLYDDSEPGKQLRYLLLFGDASFDYKDRKSDNTNFVPCWESWESLNIISSIATDDYFGCLDDGEGISNKDKVDIGIGRFPVSNVEDAQMAVDKVIHYSTKSETVFGSWRNIVTFLADDQDRNSHMHDAETLADYLETNYPVLNIDKIYVDSYEQISTPSGQRAPEVNRAINNRIDKGTLIFNYSGHGGEIGLGHERFMQLADINSWTNYDKLAVFITATCEFSRYDDPSRVSAGEQVFLNPNGGGIALFSTSRSTYASGNLALNYHIYKENLFTKTDGEYPAFGDVIMKSKVSGGDNDKKFILIGDPAMKLAYPDYQANTLKINQHVVVDGEYDTLRALQHVTIEGEIVDESNNRISDFNGHLFPTIYDKKTKVMTKGTDNDSDVEAFYLWKSIIFSGKSSITDGTFKFDFVVPKDIGYNFGKGRISYYFNNENKEGTGYYENIIIGGFDEDASGDTEGPVISLYMNDTLFRSGDITNENPVLLAYVEDESGINTTGNGIGHDIVAVIDDNSEESFVLNDFYSSDINRFNKGVITYPFRNLKEGKHTLTLKVWDIYNNSSTAEIDFMVTSSGDMVAEDLYNYPNPFFDYTTFVFSHNQAGQPVEATINIYNLGGKLVKTIKQIFSSEGYVSSQLQWNGCSDGGEKLSRGLYVYTLTLKNSNGKTDILHSKLVLNK